MEYNLEIGDAVLDLFKSCIVNPTSSFRMSIDGPKQNLQLRKNRIVLRPFQVFVLEHEFYLVIEKRESDLVESAAGACELVVVAMPAASSWTVRCEIAKYLEKQLIGAVEDSFSHDWGLSDEFESSG
jgi:hypothetical protein